MASPTVVVPGSSRAVVVVEGPFDALRVHDVTGLRARAALGVEVSLEMLGQEDGCEEVIVALDADDAGESGRRALVRRLVGARLGCAVSFLRPDEFGEAKDLDELLRVEGEDGWVRALESRCSWLAYAIDRELKHADLADEVVALRRIGGLCRAALPCWPTEVAVALRDLSRRRSLDGRFLARILVMSST